MYLLDLLKEIPDNRGTKGRQYKLSDILFMSIIAASCNYTSYREMANFIALKWEIFRDILKIKKSTAPKYNSLRQIILSVDFNDLEAVFRKHALKLSGNAKHIACDGKAMRGSAEFQEENRCIQFVNFFAVNESIIMAHEPINDKTNEIPIFQKLIDKLGIKGTIFTADALHCQKKR
jgi:hypothetical protein